ncbi:MAG TPA: hypothetical protein VJH55_00100 [Candidatus Paceibacterota bacterium]
MRTASREDEAIIPRISPRHFTKEKAAREIGLTTGEHLGMIEFDGSWRVIGWAYANDVAPRDMCKYVVLFRRREDGLEAWCHVTDYSIETIAEKVREDKTNIAPL